MTNPTSQATERFEIVFKELEKATIAEMLPGVTLFPPEADPAELREIDELRRMAMEVGAPPPVSYTGI